MKISYTVYNNSTAATMINLFTKVMGVPLILAGITFLPNNMFGYWGLVLIAVGIVIIVIGNSISKKVAQKKASKLRSDNKMNELIPLREEVVLENGIQVVRMVPDVVEGELNPPAKIILNRDKMFYAMAVKIEYFINEESIGKLKMEENTQVYSTKAVNTVSVMQEDGSRSNPITFLVRPGEEVTIHYGAFGFKGLERRY